MHQHLRVADRVAVQFLDVEVVHRQPGVPDHQSGDRGLLARPEQQNVANSQVDGVDPTSFAIIAIGIEEDVFRLRANLLQIVNPTDKKFNFRFCVCL